MSPSSCAARQMGYHQILVLGVNLGSLGFLADLSPAELRDRFPASPRGEYPSFTRHLMFECVVESPNERHTFLGLNEIAVQTAPPFHMIELELIVDAAAPCATAFTASSFPRRLARPATAFRPASHSRTEICCAFVITPIRPHTLTNRPVVDSADKVYTIAVRRASGAFLVIDGPGARPRPGRTHDHDPPVPVSFGLVKVAGRNYYQVLREKLRWANRRTTATNLPPGRSVTLTSAGRGLS